MDIAFILPQKNVSRTWEEKLHHPVEARIKRAKGKYAEKFGKGFMVIPTPMLVRNLVRRIPKGKLVTIGLIRKKLAEDFGVDYACPLTTGIFAWIVAYAAEEARANGEKRVTPWWRIVKDDGGLNPKAPGGENYQAKLLKEEGFDLVKKSLRSKKTVVKDAEAFFMHFRK